MSATPRAMSEHDPMCRQKHWNGGDCYDCYLIAKVRADELEKNPGLFNVVSASCGHTWLARDTARWCPICAEVGAGLRARMANLRAKVEELPAARIWNDGVEYLVRDATLALIDEVP